MFLTIFTPTYNRASTLPRLYASLCRQTCQDFEWIVVDDGSTDDTPQLLAAWQAEGKLSLRVHRQANAGKMAAHNRGAALAEGDMFVCVDSDDYLADHAVETLMDAWHTLPPECIGMLALKIQADGTPVTTLADKAVTGSTLKGAYDRHGLSGDAVLILQSSVLKKYTFPSFPGEKFVPENYLYDRLDREGPLRILREGLYICQYLSDGYTAHIAHTLYSNPQGYFAYITQRLQLDDTIASRFLDSIRYVAMAIAHHKPLRESPRPLWAYAALLPGYLFYLHRYRRFCK